MTRHAERSHGQLEKPSRRQNNKSDDGAMITTEIRAVARTTGSTITPY